MLYLVDYVIKYTCKKQQKTENISIRDQDCIFALKCLLTLQTRFKCRDITNESIILKQKKTIKETSETKDCDWQTNKQFFICPNESSWVRQIAVLV
jgi:hypothetical protein